MNDHELYEIAQRRIRQRNRRWMLWSLNLGVLILTLAAVVLTDGSRTAVTGFLAWGAIFVTHTIIVAFAESTQGDIEKEVVKLRKALSDEAYEKPKRLELGEDGELTEVDDREREHAKRTEDSQ